MSSSRSHPRSRAGRLRIAVIATATLGTALATTSAFAARSTPHEQVRPETGKAQPAGTHEARGFFDARRGTTEQARAKALRVSGRATSRPAAQSLTRSIGPAALLDIDGTTGTVRALADLDGYLTGAARGSAADIVTRYLTAHHDALGLAQQDLASLTLRRDYVDVVGTHHLSWVQTIGGRQVFGNGLTAAVDRSGRLLEVGGSPVADVSALAADAAGRTASGSGAAVGSGRAAISAARERSGDAATPGADDAATPVLFVAGGHAFPAWRTVTMSAAAPALSVVDAASGRLLYSRPLSSDANGEQQATRTPAPHRPKPRLAGTGLAHLYFPDAPHGGKVKRYNFAKKGWIAKNAKILSGNNSHTWSDVVDDDKPAASEEVHPKPGGRWDYRMYRFKLPGVSFCDNPYPCSWNPNKPYSWQTNRRQNAVQVFFFVNTWHDHLMKSPIGFTEAAGNFQVRNSSGKGKGGDAVRTQTDDGADSDNGLPDGSHVDNANMDTPPDGMAPTMQMYLQHQPGTSYPDGDPFAPTNVGDEADTVYHEYTHGLSNRLVVDAAGQSTLGGVQAGAMGEAWSDWYAMDYLVAQGAQADRPGVADVVLYQYDGDGVFLDRTEPIDCAVATTSERCTGGQTGHTGGYTYADYGDVVGGPEVHGDGEIWAQTLWTLRSRVGSKVAESLITRAMELAAENPSFLDMRNALLLADTSAFKGRYHSVIWSVFAGRGMGFYAGSIGGDDTTPAPDFHQAAVSSATGTITGVVTDADTGAPVAGVPVTLAFQGSGTANPTATTDATGTYTLGPVPVGHYGKLVVYGAGYEPATSEVDVVAAGTAVPFTVRRDWAAASGGATVDDFTGPDYTDYDCGPGNAIDLSQGTVWETSTGNDDADPTGTFVPKTITIKLPQAVDVTGFGVDPSNGCGDGGSASTGDYTIEVATDSGPFTQAAAGTFTVDDRGRVNQIGGGDDAVRYVRFTILGNQTPDFATNCPGGSFSGCTWTDLTELEVYGTASN